jgi:hypothetical protein
MRSFLGISMLLAASLLMGTPARTPARDKTVWNYGGGVFLETDGSLGEGPCFRIAGRLTGGQFFDDLKRIDDLNGTRFLRGKQLLTEFPDQLSLSLVIRDQPCPAEPKAPVTRKYLTREVMQSMRLSLYWKRGMNLRPVEKPAIKNMLVEKLEPYRGMAETLPPRFEWKYALEIPSAGVPLTDSLVLVLKTADGRIAARVAARL